MRSLIAACAATLLFATVARADDARPLTNAQAQMVLTGLAQLDGYDRIVKDGERERSVHETYKLGSGLRLQIARSIAQLRTAITAFQDANNGLIRQYAPDGATVPPAQMGAFIADQKKLLDASSGVSLPHIKVSELKLDDNPIQATTLSMLDPILDQ